jgi:pyridoxal phosphate enzyme (YggS family)
VVVTKYRTLAEIDAAVRAGVTDIGENRVQEAEQKQPRLAGRDIVWHLVGHLQSNKAKRAVKMFEWIHSLHSIELARRVNRLAEEQGKIQRVLVQVDLAGEETKSGLADDRFFETAEQIDRLEFLSMEGLMVLPPFLSDPEAVRPYFSRLRELRDGARRRGVVGSSLKELSMGMSHDFEVAIEEGATMVRIGTALFGERPSSQPSLVGDANTPQEEGP